MKKLILVTLIITGFGAKAQHDVSLDVLGFAFSKYGLGYEYAINSNNSVGINFNISSKNMFDDGIANNLYSAAEDGDYKYSEMNIIPEYKYFMTPNKGNDGIYIGIYGKYRSSSSTGNSYFVSDITNVNFGTTGTTDVSTTGISLGAMLGYKWQTTGALFLEVTAGVGKFLMSDVTVSDAIAEDLTEADFNRDDYVPYIGNTLAVDLRLAVKIGLRFGGGSSSE